MEIRLQKIIADAGICSRRRAEELIRAGRVSVDGEVVIAMGVKFDPGRHLILCDGRPLRGVEKKIYLLLNKPLGYVTTLRDPQGRPTVLDLLPGIRERVFPVGRLDLDTEGALLLTNDGDLAERVQHPRFNVNKTYIAEVRGRPAPDRLRQLETGVVIDGHRTWPAAVRLLASNPRSSTVEIIIHEGKKRQVRKMFQAIGHVVLRLKRTAYGELCLGDLGPGKFRPLQKNDLKKIFSEKISLHSPEITDYILNSY